jgi:ubiquitin C-terminal hydrolase
MTEPTDHGFSLQIPEDRGFESAFEPRTSSVVNPAKYAASKYHIFLPYRLSENESSKTFYIRVILQEHNTPERVLGNYSSKLYTGLVGLENLGATCYLNSLLQMLFHINAFRKAVYELPHKEENMGSTTYTLALQNVFRHLQMSDKEVNTQELLTAFGWTSQDAFAQQDVQEMMRILLDKLEEKMKGTVVDGAIRNLFCGTVRSYIKCVNVDYSSIREEDFYDIQLDVKGCGDIHDSFKKYIAKEMLDGDNQYDAGEYGKQDAEKGVIFTKFPPVLTLLLKRFDFDLQRMRFIKIHDQYKFTTRINLDTYLAEDVPSDIKSSNNYVLHSVLVHMGDVGGGHYYAYIRPSIGFSYDFSMTDVLNSWPKQEIQPSSSADEENTHISYREKVARDGRWFKFNDDCVNEVRESEAVNLSFGKSADQGRHSFVSISSAYMLVYLRENEAKSIMSEVIIPPDLIHRLEQESRIQNAILRQRERQLMYKTFFYATEDDVRSFRDYSRQEDFLPTQNLHRIRFIARSSRMSVFWRICKLFGDSVPPTCIRLHDIYFPTRSSSSRVGLPHSFEGYKEAIDDEDIYYIHLHKLDLPTGQAEEICRLFHEVQGLEDDWLSDLRNQLQNEFSLTGIPVDDKNNVDNESEDLVEGCGLFCNNDPIISLIIDHNIRKHYKQRLDELQRRVIDTMKHLIELQSPVEIERDNFIAFIKVFDPYNLFPVDDFELNQQQQLSPKDPRVDQSSYIPIKFLMSMDVSRKTTVGYIMDNIRNTIDTIYDNMNIPAPNRPKFSKGNEPEKMFLCMNPLGAGCDIICSAYEDGEENLSEQQLYPRNISDAISTHFNLIIGKSAVFIIQLYPRSDRPSRSLHSLLPFERLNSPKDWLSFMSTKKTFRITPYTPFDVDMVADAVRKRIYRLQQQSIATATTAAPSALPRKATFSEMKQNSRNANASETSNTSDSEIDSISDESSLDSEAIFSDKELTNLGCFYAEFPSNMTLKEIADHAHRLLQCGSEIASNRLVFYIISDKEYQSLASFPHVQHARPMIGQANKPLSVFLQDRKIVTGMLPGVRDSNNLVNYHMFYQILPFPLIVGDKDLRESYRFVDIVIVDHRIRLWRQRYLLRGQRAADADPADGSSAKRQRLGLEAEASITDDSASKSFVVKRNLFLSIQTADQVVAAAATSSGSGTVISNILEIDEQEIIWPPVEEAQRIPDAFLSDRRVIIQVRKRLTISNMIDILRNVIGIPINASAFEVFSAPNSSSAHEAISKPDGGSEDTESTAEDISSLLKPLPLNSMDGEPLITTATTNHRAVAEKAQTRTHDVVSHIFNEDDDKAYPMALLHIRDNMISDIYQASHLVELLYFFWPEALDSLMNTMHRKLAVQHIARADLIWMRGEHPSIRSTMVSVFNFTLLGNGCSPIPLDSVEPLAFAGPALSYVRQDDDYESVCRRIAELFGESIEESAKYRLAVVHKRIPTFISRGLGHDPRPSPSPSHLHRYDSTDSNQFFTANPTSGGVGEEMIGPQPNPYATNSPFSSSTVAAATATGPLNTHNGDLWSLLQEKYPHFTNFSYETARNQR